MSAVVPQALVTRSGPSASRVAVSVPPLLVAWAPVKLNPAPRSGVVAAGVGGGGPTGTMGSVVHGGGTIAGPPSGWTAGNVNSRSSFDTPIAELDSTAVAFDPSASMVHQPAAPPVPPGSR